MSLFTELKRRKVFRVAVVYAATAFVVLQAADIMLPRLAVPEWAMTLVVVFAVLGFPPASPRRMRAPRISGSSNWMSSGRMPA